VVRHSNIEAERTVLGAILLDNTLLPDITQKISARDFHDVRNQKIFTTMDRLKELDILTLSEELRSKGKLDDIGIDFVYGLTDVITTEGVDKYVDIIKKLSLKRNHIANMTNMIADINDGHEVEELYDFYSEMQSTLNGHESSKWENIGSGYSRIHDRIARVIEGTEPFGIPTGFEKLDRVTGGAKPGELWVWAAMSSHGKTTAATQVAIRAAESGKHVGFFSFEMNRETLLMYHASRIAGLDYNDVVNGNISHKENTLFMNEMGKLSKLNIDVYESSMLTPEQLVHEGTKKEFDIVLIDYLQRFSQRKGQQLRETIANGAKQAKTLAKELNAPVFLVSSITKEVGNRAASRLGAPGLDGLKGVPNKADLKESGDIEYEADNVVLMTIPSKCGNMVDLTDGWWILAKQRTGPTATIRMTWDKNFWKDY